MNYASTSWCFGGVTIEACRNWFTIEHRIEPIGCCSTAAAVDCCEMCYQAVLCIHYTSKVSLILFIIVRSNCGEKKTCTANGFHKIQICLPLQKWRTLAFLQLVFTTTYCRRKHKAAQGHWIRVLVVFHCPCSLNVHFWEDAHPQWRLGYKVQKQSHFMYCVCLYIVVFL